MILINLRFVYVFLLTFIYSAILTLTHIPCPLTTTLALSSALLAFLPPQNDTHRTKSFLQMQRLTQTEIARRFLMNC